MNLKDYAAHDALGLAQLVKNKEVMAEELLDCALQASEALNGDLSAIVRSMSQRRAPPLRWASRTARSRASPFCSRT